MPKATPIPSSSRTAVDKRDRGRCVRCAGRATEWHHRRTRSVRDEHTHHPGNGISLCLVCHDWVHDNPTQARDLGLIVSRYETHPCITRFKGYYGWAQPACLSTTLTLTGA